MALIYDLIEPQTLQGFARNLAYPDLVLDGWLPNFQINDIEFRFDRQVLGSGSVLYDEDVATYRAFDTEAPIAGRKGTELSFLTPPTVRGQIPPLSRKIRLGEEERLRMDALRTGDKRPIIDQIFNDVGRLTRSIQARLELARGQALVTGAVTIAENGVAGSIDFGVPASNFVVAPIVWTDPDALVVDDLLGWMQIYTDLNGQAPVHFVTSTRIINGLLRNNQIRNLAGGLAPIPNIVTPATVNAVLSAYGLPTPEVYDTQLKVDGVAQRVIPDDKVLFLPAKGNQLGRTFYGVTAEALELQSEGKIVSRQAPGIVAVVEKTFDPVATWTKVAALAIPVMTAPSLLMVADVA